MAPLEGHPCRAHVEVQPCRTPSAGDPTQPHILCPVALTRAAQDPEKGDTGETPPATLVPGGDMHSAPCVPPTSCVPAPGLVARPAFTSVQKGAATVGSASASKQGSGCRVPARGSPRDAGSPLRAGLCHRVAGWAGITGQARCSRGWPGTGGDAPADAGEVTGTTRAHAGAGLLQGWVSAQPWAPRGTGGSSEPAGTPRCAVPGQPAWLNPCLIPLGIHRTGHMGCREELMSELSQLMLIKFI